MLKCVSHLYSQMRAPISVHWMTQVTDKRSFFFHNNNISYKVESHISLFNFERNQVKNKIKKYEKTEAERWESKFLHSTIAHERRRKEYKNLKLSKLLYFSLKPQPSKKEFLKFLPHHDSTIRLHHNLTSFCLKLFFYYFLVFFSRFFVGRVLWKWEIRSVRKNKFSFLFVALFSLCRFLCVYSTLLSSLSITSEVVVHRRQSWFNRKYSTLKILLISSYSSLFY